MAFRKPPMDAPVGVRRLVGGYESAFVPDPAGDFSWSGNPGQTILTESSLLSKDYEAFNLSFKKPTPVTISVSYLEAKELNPQVDRFLVLEWGIQNFAAGPVEVDIGFGLMLSMVATSLKGIIRVTPPGATQAGVNRIGAMVSPGMRPGHYPPTRTKKGAVINAGGNGGEVSIPQFARGVTPVFAIGGAATGIDFMIRQKDDGGGVFTEHPFISSGYMFSPRIPLLNWASKIDTVNVDAVSQIDVSYIFDLAF